VQGKRAAVSCCNCNPQCCRSLQHVELKRWGHSLSSKTAGLQHTHRFLILISCFCCADLETQDPEHLMHGFSGPGQVVL
jgi:hypothetical protein